MASPDEEYLSYVSKRKSLSVHYVAALIIAILVVIGIAVGIAVGLTLGQTIGDESTTPRPTAPAIRSPPTGPPDADGPYRHGVVASGAGPCSEIGRDILKRNGTVVDSAVATLFCVGVYDMHSAGVGGGGFMLVYIRAQRSAEVVDFREEAPGKANPYMYVNGRLSSKYGGSAVAVPGEVKGLHTAWKEYGRLPWKDLVQPAIDMARNGFTLGRAVHHAASRSSVLSSIRADPGLRELLLNRTGHLKPIGYVLRTPKLARTLKMIRDDPDRFYTGDLAKKIAKDVQRAGGLITKKDLENYKVKIKKALEVTMGEYTLFSTPPPGSGAMLSLIMNILKEILTLRRIWQLIACSGYNMTSADLSGRHSVLTYHRIAEAFKFAFAYRALLGDEVSKNVTKVVANMTDPVYAESLRQKIWDNKTFSDYKYYGDLYFDATDHDASHVSVIASNGDAVSATITINMPFGSKYRSNRTGIIYNNQMDAFSSPDENADGAKLTEANFVRPGKRPQSSTAPAIFIDQNGVARVVAGASGGMRVTTAIAQVAMNYLWFNHTLSQSVEEPRLHHQLIPMFVQLVREHSLPQAIQDGLRRLGHVVQLESEFASVQATATNSDGSLWGKTDTNDYGWASGY